jgi:rod shape determining protein RodA
MNRREGYTGFTRGEARNATARSLDLQGLGPFGKIVRLPWGFIFAVVAMSMVGFATLFSSTYNTAGPSGGEEGLWIRQASTFAIFFPVMIGMALIPISLFMRLAYVAFAVTIVLLVMTDLFGLTRGGAERWLKLGPITFQASELAKLTVALALARYYQTFLGPGSNQWLTHFGAFIILVIPCYFVFHQPDLGTALAIASAGFIIMFLAGVPFSLVIGGAVAGLASLPIIYSVVLKPYQRERVDTMLAQMRGESTNSLGESYQIEQGLIAIGSGGVRGKGYLQGIQSQQDFVPEQHTDFILTVIAEEFGFLGTLALMLAFAFLLGWSLNVAYQARSWFTKLAAAGATAVIAFYLVFNVGMVTGLLPVVGMPLPLVSHGRTAMLTIMTCFGVILSCYMHRDEKVQPKGFL